jgi:hypothetical protein
MMKSFPEVAVLDDVKRKTTAVTFSATLWYPLRVKKAHTAGQSTPFGPVRARIGGPIDTHEGDEVNGLQLLGLVISQISKEMFMSNVV